LIEDVTRAFGNDIDNRMRSNIDFQLKISNFIITDRFLW